MNKRLIKQLAVCATGLAIIQPALRADSLEARAEIRFRGSSTLHDFEGTACTLPFTAVFRENGRDDQLVVAARTVVEVGKMTTDNSKRDRNMFKMFDLEHFARIEGQLPETVVSLNEHSEALLHLRICNEEHDVKAAISELHRAGNIMTCTMTFPISLKEFHLKGPSVLGMIRVDDTVYIECDIQGTIVPVNTGS